MHSPQYFTQYLGLEWRGAADLGTTDPSSARHMSRWWGGEGGRGRGQNADAGVLLPATPNIRHCPRSIYSPPPHISRFKFIMTENSQHSQTWHISREERRMEIIYYDNKQKQCSRSQLSQISVNSHLCTSATFTLHSLLLILYIMIIWRLLAKIIRYLEQFVEEWLSM